MSRPTKRMKLSTKGNIAIPSLFDEHSSIKFNQPQVVAAGRYRGSANEVHVLDIDSSSWKNQQEWAPADNSEFVLFPDSQWFDEALDTEVMASAPVAPPQQMKPVKSRSNASTRLNVEWKEKHRSTYADELCRWDGRGEFMATSTCPDCVGRGMNPPGPAIYRCESGCLIPNLYCQDCCVRRHHNFPLHRVQKWTGTHFIDVSLKSIGLVIQLNHTSASSTCSVPKPGHSNLVILHTNGMHEVAFSYCGCSHTIPEHQQLMRRRIYPASQIVIQTCASFDLLELLHKLSLTTKASLYDFYNGIARLTDSTGLRLLKSKYRPLMRMLRQWRHAKMLKYAGRAVDPAGVEGTKPGTCAVRCLSCARPGINLPDDWETKPPEDQYLYRGFTAMDANFRLKNQLVSTFTQDPGLSGGLAFMVPRREYESYQLLKRKESDISTCVGFQAIAQSTTRFSRGLRYTGVGGIFCGRLEMLLPLGMGNLQKGERYSNMDYIFASGDEYRAIYGQNAMISLDLIMSCAKRT